MLRVTETLGDFKSASYGVWSCDFSSILPSCRGNACTLCWLAPVFCCCHHQQGHHQPGPVALLLLDCSGMTCHPAGRESRRLSGLSPERLRCPEARAAAKLGRSLPAGTAAPPGAPWLPRPRFHRTERRSRLCGHRLGPAVRLTPSVNLRCRPHNPHAKLHPQMNGTLEPALDACTCQGQPLPGAGAEVQAAAQ
jgi:hypothetical protein